MYLEAAVSKVCPAGCWGCYLGLEVLAFVLFLNCSGIFGCDCSRNRVDKTSRIREGGWLALDRRAASSLSVMKLGM